MSARNAASASAAKSASELLEGHLPAPDQPSARDVPEGTSCRLDGLLSGAQSCNEVRYAEHLLQFDVVSVLGKRIASKRACRRGTRSLRAPHHLRLLEIEGSRTVRPTRATRARARRRAVRLRRDSRGIGVTLSRKGRPGVAYRMLGNRASGEPAHRGVAA